MTGARPTPAADGAKKGALSPGHVYTAVRARIFAAAMRTPSRWAQAEQQALIEELTREISALPGSDDPDTLARRLRHIAPADVTRSWEGALAQSDRRPWYEATPEGERARHSPVAVREVLRATMDDIVKGAIYAVEGATAPDKDEDGEAVTLFQSVDQMSMVRRCFRRRPPAGRT